MANPKFTKYFFDIAWLTASLSTATRLKVGAVAVIDLRPVAVGYNGTSPAEDNNCEYIDDNGLLVSKSTVIHAEDNLIRFANNHSIDLSMSDLYITHSPCIDCANKIVKSKFKSVTFSEYYKNNDGIDYILANNIYISQFNF